MSDSTKTTVYLDSADYRRLKALAKAHGRSAAELVREAVAVYTRIQTQSEQPASIGAGRSGRGDLSERARRTVGARRRVARRHGARRVIVADRHRRTIACNGNRDR